MGKITLKNGCTGCNRYWHLKQPADCPVEMRAQEGQCSQCKRCHECCSKASIPYTCEWRYQRMPLADKIRHNRAVKRYMENENILFATRRVGR